MLIWPSVFMCRFLPFGLDKEKNTFYSRRLLKPAFSSHSVSSFCDQVLQSPLSIVRGVEGSLYLSEGHLGQQVERTLEVICIFVSTFIVCESPELVCKLPLNKRQKMEFIRGQCPLFIRSNKRWIKGHSQSSVLSVLFFQIKRRIIFNLDCAPRPWLLKGDGEKWKGNKAANTFLNCDF